MMYTFTEAQRDLSKARDKGAGRPVGNNTRLHYVDGTNGADIAVKLHNTDVVTIHSDGTYTLNSGGWRTSTTKARINEHSPARVYSKRGEWRIWRRDATGIDEEWPFFDGIHVNADGCPVGLQPWRSERDEATRKRYKAEVRKYIRGFLAHLATLDKLPEPNGGDCWGCYFEVQGDPNKAPMGWGHIWGHFEDKYYVPSLLFKAFMERNPAGGQWHYQAYEYKRSKRDFYWSTASLRAYFRKHERDICAVAPTK